MEEIVKCADAAIETHGSWLSALGPEGDGAFWLWVGQVTGLKGAANRVSFPVMTK
jgi:hypothetical protein